MSRLGAGFGFGVVDFEGEGALLGVRVAGLGDFVARASHFDGLGVGSRAGCRGGIGGVVGEAELFLPGGPASEVLLVALSLCVREVVAFGGV